jgi:hypothetical protein
MRAMTSAKALSVAATVPLVNCLARFAICSPTAQRGAP